LKKQGDHLLLRAVVEIESYVLKHYNKDQSWLFRKVQNMFELRDLPIYQEIKKWMQEEYRQEGLQEGLQEGRQEGLQEGRQEAARRPYGIC